MHDEINDQTQTPSFDKTNTDLLSIDNQEKLHIVKQ